jgi:hypothetical protein
MNKYIDLISKDAKETALEELKFRAEEAQHDVTGAILETKKQLAQKKNALAKAQRAVPYSLQGEINLTVEIEVLKKGLSIAEDILKTRF